MQEQSIQLQNNDQLNSMNIKCNLKQCKSIIKPKLNQFLQMDKIWTFMNEKNEKYEQFKNMLQNQQQVIQTFSKPQNMLMMRQNLLTITKNQSAQTKVDVEKGYKMPASIFIDLVSPTQQVVYHQAQPQRKHANNQNYNAGTSNQTDSQFINDLNWTHLNKRGKTLSNSLYSKKFFQNIMNRSKIDKSIQYFNQLASNDFKNLAQQQQQNSRQQFQAKGNNFNANLNTKTKQRLEGMAMVKGVNEIMYSTHRPTTANAKIQMILRKQSPNQKFATERITTKRKIAKQEDDDLFKMKISISNSNNCNNKIAQEMVRNKSCERILSTCSTFHQESMKTFLQLDKQANTDEVIKQQKRKERLRSNNDALLRAHMTKLLKRGQQTDKYNLADKSNDWMRIGERRASNALESNNENSSQKSNILIEQTTRATNNNKQLTFFQIMRPQLAAAASLNQMMMHSTGNILSSIDQRKVPIKQTRNVNRNNVCDVIPEKGSPIGRSKTHQGTFFRQ